MTLTELPVGTAAATESSRGTAAGWGLRAVAGVGALLVIVGAPLTWVYVSVDGLLGERAISGTVGRTDGWLTLGLDVLALGLLPLTLHPRRAARVTAATGLLVAALVTGLVGMVDGDRARHLRATGTYLGRPLVAHARVGEGLVLTLAGAAVLLVAAATLLVAQLAVSREGSEAPPQMMNNDPLV